MTSGRPPPTPVGSPVVICGGLLWGSPWLPTLRREVMGMPTRKRCHPCTSTSSRTYQNTGIVSCWTGRGTNRRIGGRFAVRRGAVEGSCRRRRRHAMGRGTKLPNMKSISFVNSSRAKGMCRSNASIFRMDVGHASTGAPTRSSTASTKSIVCKGGVRNHFNISEWQFLQLQISP